MLGEIIERLDTPGTAETTLIEAGGLALLADVRGAATDFGMRTGDFAALAVRRFTERADNEAWLQLIGIMQNSDTPGVAALAAILKQAVADARKAS